jgi:hypothetical protein
MDWFTTTTSISWLTVLLVGLTMFMVGGGAEALLQVDKKAQDTEVVEHFLKIAKRVGIALIVAGIGLGTWIWLR